MLKPAILYKQQLSWIIPMLAFDPRYKFWLSDCYTTYEIEIENGTWSKLQFVSVDSKDNIHGYFNATIHRAAHYVSNMGMVNFSKNPSFIFSKDMSEFFLSLLLQHNFNKLVWSMVKGNPAEQIYQRVCDKYGGRKVAEFRDNVKLTDGKLYNECFFEIMKKDFEEKIGEKKILHLRVARGW